MRITLLLLLPFLALTFNSNAQSDQRSNFQQQTIVPNLYSRVNDYSNLLTDENESALRSKLQSLEDSIGSQIVILTIDSLNGNSIEDYSMMVAERWRIGRKDFDDGIIITLAVQEQDVRIEVGYGLELIIRDEIAKSIIDNLMVPHFMDGNFYAGLSISTQEIIDLIYKNPELVGKRP